MKLVEVTLIVLFLSVVYATPVYAYLDPGSGSYLLQIIIAGLVGGLFTIKTFWFQIKSFFTNIFIFSKKNKTKAAPKKNGDK